MRCLFNRIFDRRCDRTLAVASQRPALIGKTIDAIITENEMVEQPDAQQVSSFPQSCGERSILRARRGISGRMIVDGNDRTGVEEDRGLEHLTWMHNAEIECTD
jgi:hypothetical protein